MSLSWALTLQGTIGEALEEAERAVPVLEGTARARMQAQRALILQRLGRLDDALAGYRRPLSCVPPRRRRAVGGAAAVQPRRPAGLSRRAGRGRGRLQARGGAARGQRPGARRDPGPPQLRLGRGASRRRPPGAGVVRPRRDRVPLARRASGAAVHGPLRGAAVRAPGDRSARERARRRRRAGRGRHGLRPRRGAPAGCPGRAACAPTSSAAHGHADRADHAFARQHRPGWSALARSAAAQAAWLESQRADGADAADGAGGAGGAGGARPARPARGGAGGAAGAAGAGGTDAAAGDPRAARLEAALSAARRAIRALEAVGWGAEALDARLIAGRAALELGRTRFAQSQLELAAAHRDRGPVQQRTRAWHAAALLRLSRGDRRGASAAVAAGLRALEAHRMTLGATELRAHASGHGEELATLGLRLAVAVRRRRAGPGGGGAAQGGRAAAATRAPAGRRGARERPRRAAPRHRRTRRVAARRPPRHRARPAPDRAGELRPPPRPPSPRRRRD